MKPRLLLAHDLGTSGVKSSLLTEDGRLLGSCATAYETLRRRPRFREQNPEDWWAGVVKNTRELVGYRSADGIEAMAVSGHMLGLVLVDSAGEPVVPAMIHSDTRATEETAAIRAAVGDDAFYHITGNRLDPRSSLCKLEWVRRNRPAEYRRASRVLQSKDYVVGRLVGRFDTTDFSDASHASFLDVAAGRYAEDLLSERGISSALLPEVRPATARAGALSLRAAAALGLPSGIPVAVGAGDGSSASVGAGAAASGQAYCCLGTTAWIAVCGGAPVIDPAARVFNIMSASGPSCDWFGTVQSAGASIRWALGVLGIESFDSVDGLVASVPPGSDGVLFLPYLDGERSPIFDDSARGVWFGMSSAHGRAHLLRAVYEGVAFALRDVLLVMKRHARVDELRFIGGGFRSSLLRQITADVLEVPLLAVGVPAEDATSLGAALIAGTAVGLFDDLPDAVSRIPVAGPVLPQGASRAYRDAYSRYSRLYPALKDQFLRD